MGKHRPESIRGDPAPVDFNHPVGAPFEKSPRDFPISGQHLQLQAIPVDCAWRLVQNDPAFGAAYPAHVMESVGQDFRLAVELPAGIHLLKITPAAPTKVGTGRLLPVGRGLNQLAVKHLKIAAPVGRLLDPDTITRDNQREKDRLLFQEGNPLATRDHALDRNLITLHG